LLFLQKNIIGSLLIVFWLAVNPLSGLADKAAMAACLPVSQENIYQEAMQFNGLVGLYAKNLKTGKVIAYQPNLIFPTASTSKLFVVITVYKYLYPQATVEQQQLYDQQIKDAIEFSDNDAFYQLLEEIDQIRPDALALVTQDMKLSQTFIHNEDAYLLYQYHSVTTAQEMAMVLETLVTTKYLDLDKTELLKQELANTIFAQELPRYLPSKVMHKVGELDQVLCDVGLVEEGPNQVIISVYTASDMVHDDASDFIANISQMIYYSIIEIPKKTESVVYPKIGPRE
jgi:beta-lactamase class A